MKNRIKQIRKDSELNQTEFGSRIGVAQTTIAGYENGSRAVPDVAIRSICREFGINESWLRNGIGEMKASISREQEMAALVSSLMSDRPESLRSALITALLRFDPNGDEWKVLERIYEDVANIKNQGE